MESFQHYSCPTHSKKISNCFNCGVCTTKKKALNKKVNKEFSDSHRTQETIDEIVAVILNTSPLITLILKNTKQNRSFTCTSNTNVYKQ